MEAVLLGKLLPSSGPNLPVMPMSCSRTVKDTITIHEIFQVTVALWVVKLGVCWFWLNMLKTLTVIPGTLIHLYRWIVWDFGMFCLSANDWVCQEALTTTTFYIHLRNFQLEPYQFPHAIVKPCLWSQSIVQHVWKNKWLGGPLGSLCPEAATVYKGMNLHAFANYTNGKKGIPSGQFDINT